MAASHDLLDSAVPFRAKPSYRHSTWARTFHSRPEFFIQPESVEEVQKIVALATRCRRRLVTVGSGHSPSDLTCSSSWMISLDKMTRVLDVKRDATTQDARVTFQAGLALGDLDKLMGEAPHALTIPNIGSINVQSLAGAIATGTHGSSLRHGLLSSNVSKLRIVLADGNAVWCSAEDRPDLFRAALVSLGALGIVVEVEFRMVPRSNVEWSQSMISLEDSLERWNTNLWTEAEFTRCWWMPYMRRLILWQGEKTQKAVRKPKASWYGGALGFHTYHTLLWISHYIPSFLPTVEWFVFGMQYRFSPGHITDAIEDQHAALLMDCLFSQFVNEWALPLSKGPEALRRLSAWISGDEKASGIPFSSKGVYVHCPIEVRVTNGTSETTSTRGFMDPTMPDEPTLYLNATLYRPFKLDPPCTKRYYEAFEWLMKDLGGRPHWAKNFQHVKATDVKSMYGENLDKFMHVRNEVDPDGMFLGAWHRRVLLGDGPAPLLLEERELERKVAKTGGGTEWVGSQGAKAVTVPSFDKMRSSKSESSFDSFNASTESGEEVSMSESLRAERSGS